MPLTYIWKTLISGAHLTKNLDCILVEILAAACFIKECIKVEFLFLLPVTKWVDHAYRTVIRLVSQPAPGLCQIEAASFLLPT